MTTELIAAQAEVSRLSGQLQEKDIEAALEADINDPSVPDQIRHQAVTLRNQIKTWREARERFGS